MSSSSSKPRREWVPVDRLIRDPSLQMRSNLPNGLTDPATVERYLEAMADGDVFPPLEAVYDGSAYWLVDGFQRAEAIDRCSKGSAECLVHNGTYEDALFRALSANARHGLTRTSNDCRRVLSALLDSPILLSRVLARGAESGGAHRALASACCVSKSLVAKMLEERGLHVQNGRILKRPPAPAPHRSADIVPLRIPAAEPEEPPTRPMNAASDVNDIDAKADAPPNVEHELGRALAAIRTIWSACRTALDSPLAAHLLRIANLHSAPFSQVGSPTTTLTQDSASSLSAAAWWEPLGKVEAVVSDLYVAATSDPG